MRPNFLQDSSIYQLILAEGRGEGRAVGRMDGELIALRRSLRSVGTQRFGPPLPEDEMALARIEDIHRLDRMIDRILSAADWTDLLRTQ